MDPLWAEVIKGITNIGVRGGGRERSGVRSPERDVFVPARGGGVVSARAVSLCGVRSVSVTVENAENATNMKCL